MLCWVCKSWAADFGGGKSVFGSFEGFPRVVSQV